MVHADAVSPGENDRFVPASAVIAPRERISRVSEVSPSWDSAGQMSRLRYNVEILDLNLESAPAFASKAQVVRIRNLPNRFLLTEIDAILEPDGEGFIARSVDIPVYGYGEDAYEAVESLRREIESLYDDLMEDDDFTDDWLRIKKFLRQAVAD